MEEELRHEQWTGRTGGTAWMQRALISCFRFLPLWFYYGMVAMMVPFYMMCVRYGYLSMFRFFRQAMGYSRVRSFFAVYANHYRFGQIIVDRFAKYAGRKFNFQRHNGEMFDEMLSAEGSFIMLSSHVGNYEMVGYSFASSKRVNALVYEKEAETVMKNRRKQFESTNISMIPVRSDMSHLFLMNNALSDGEIVSMPGDRLFGSPKGIECDFFGHVAKFPMGPFATIVQRKVDAVAMFAMKTGYRRYDIYVHPLTHDLPEGLKSRELMNIVAQRFAGSIEEIVRKYPTQWFNYFDFWNQ